MNNPEMMEALIEYGESRITQAHGFLETTASMEKVIELQTVIKEARRFKTLRDEVIAGAK